MLASWNEFSLLTSLDQESLQLRPRHSQETLLGALPTRQRDFLGLTGGSSSWWSKAIFLLQGNQERKGWDGCAQEKEGAELHHNVSKPKQPLPRARSPMAGPEGTRAVPTWI